MSHKSSFEVLLEESMENTKNAPKEVESFNRSLADSFYSSVEDHDDTPASCMKHDFTDEEYFGVKAYSSTYIKLYIKNPDLINYKDFSQKDYEINKYDSKKFGSAIHRIVLENYPIRSFDSELTPKSQQILRNMIRTLSRSPEVMKVLNNVEAFERAIFWNFDCRDKSISCKAKVDLVTKDDELFDLKTVPELEDMEKQIDNYRYDLQLSFYRYGWQKKYKKKIKRVCILAMEKNPPYGCRIFELGEDYLDRGRFGGLTMYKQSVPGWEKIIEEMHFNPRDRFSGKRTLLTLN